MLSGEFMTHPTDEQLNDYLERALSPAHHVEVARHLEGCADCARVVGELEHIVREAASLAPLTPPAHAWTRLERRMEGGQRAEGRGQRAEGRGQRAEGRGQTRWGPVWALATAALVVLAFLTGRFVEHRTSPQSQASIDPAQPAGVANVAAASVVRERVLLVAVGDHLERSQMVLVELANAQTHDELDISAERQSADELLASNRLYRQTAAQIGQTNVAEVLDDLERVLVEVARGPSRLSIQQLAAIQQQIEAQGILFKVKIIRNNSEYR
jgi:hypothetical protein